MVIFRYDKTFEGLLTCVFDAYFRKTFPSLLLAEEENPPLFYDEMVAVHTDMEKSERVWKALEKKLSRTALSCLTYGWLSELPEVDNLIFRYIRKAVDYPKSIETNFADPDVLELSKIWKKVSHERHRVMEFARFQKASDDTYFAPMEPIYNVLSLTTGYFLDRFADQKWLVYDIKRQYGYFYDLHEMIEVTFEEKSHHLITGMLDESLMATDEKLFQKMWKTYFKSIAIKERINPKLHRQHMPARFWKHLTEKQR